MRNSIRSFLDRLAVVGSALCILHCLALPLVLALIPSSTLGILQDELFHKLMLGLVIPTSILAVFFGYKKHQDMLVLSGVVSGLFMLIFAGFFGHDILGEMGEKTFTVLGASILAFSHIRNTMLCRACCK